MLSGDFPMYFMYLSVLKKLVIDGLNLFFFLINLFIYLWLCWVFDAPRGLSLVAASGGYSSLRCAGFSLWGLLIVVSSLVEEHGLQACRLQQLWHAGSVVVAHGLQSTGSVVVAHGLSCSAACGIFPDQGSNPCPLRWQVDS